MVKISNAKSPIQLIFIIFLLVVFVSGIFVCLNGSITSYCSTCNHTGMREYMDGTTTGIPGTTGTTGIPGTTGTMSPNNSAAAGVTGAIDKSCANMLVKRDNSYLLYNNNLPEKEGENPRMFKSLDEYIKFLDGQKAKGLNCPVLYMQQESDAQGNDVFRMRPSPFLMDGGLQPMPMFDMDKVTPVKMIDATVEDPNYNQGQYPAFDPTSQYIGQITDVDVVHYSTTKQDGGISDNAMDNNWGGVMYTQDSLGTGKYDENNVYKVLYPSMGR